MEGMIPGFFKDSVGGEGMLIKNYRPLSHPYIQIGIS